MLSTAGFCDWFRSPDLLVSWETNMSIVKRILPLIAATFTLFAQTDRGSIEGTVKDPNGPLVPGAKVQVVNIETNSKLDFQTDDSGTTWHPTCRSVPTAWWSRRRVSGPSSGNRSWSRRRATWRWILLFRSAPLPTRSRSATNRRYWTSRPPPTRAISPSKFIDDLPMIVFGEKRNITDNLRFLPGNTSTNGSLGSGEPAESWSGRVNSAVQGSTEIFIDGAPSSELGTRRGSVLENGPVVEQVAEYTVVANAFNAEYRRFRELVHHGHHEIRHQCRPRQSLRLFRQRQAERPQFLPGSGQTEAAAERRRLPGGRPGLHPQDL